MTIKDLRFIHDLLVEEVEARQGVMKAAADALYKAEEIPVECEVMYARGCYEKFRDEYYEARRVLDNFEDKQWK